MINHFCTYFDQNYLIRVVALYRSMEAHFQQPFVLWILCMDEAAFVAITALNESRLRPVRLTELESADRDLASVKGSRSLYEYYFTCTAAWSLYLLRTYPEIERITYLDADMLFFADVSPVFDEMGTGSILIIPHRFSEALREREVYGIYNVGLLTFRSDSSGLACLNWWREKCIEWCYDRLEDDRFADQKYLNQWQELFTGVVVLTHIGVNTAPWNFSNYKFSQRGKDVYVNETQLILYHYQGLKLVTGWLCDPGVYQYADMPNFILNMIYQPYVKALRKAWKQIKATNSARMPGYTGFKSRQYNRRTFLTQFRLGKIIIVIPPIS